MLTDLICWIWLSSGSSAFILYELRTRQWKNSLRSIFLYIIKEHGGKIKVEKLKDSGSVVTFTLPINQEAREDQV
jgi:hypothetical protein